MLEVGRSSIRSYNVLSMITRQYFSLSIRNLSHHPYHHNILSSSSSSSSSSTSHYSPSTQSKRSIMSAEKVTLFDAMGVTGKYKFSIGAPGPLDLKKVAALMERVCKQRMIEEQNTDGASLLQYGAPLGDPRSIRALARFLTAEYGMPVSESNLAFTSGATGGFTHLITQLFPNKCDVYAEALTYHVALQMLRDLNFNIRSVPVESDGMNMDELEKIWAKNLKEMSAEEQSKLPYQAMLYTVPTFQNPTGTILSPEKCERLIKLARKYHVLVLSEDVYNMLYYDGSGKPPKRLFAYDNVTDADYGIGHVLSNCTFSKLLSPGLRLGWQELPIALREKYYDKSSILISSGGLNPVIGGCITIALEDGSASKFIDEIRKSHAKKMQITIETLEKEMPSSCKLYYPAKGGYFLYVLLPDQLNAADFVKYVKEKYSVGLQEGIKFASSSANFAMEMSNGIRIAIPYPTIEEVQEGIHCLCKALHEYSSK